MVKSNCDWYIKLMIDEMREAAYHVAHRVSLEAKFLGEVEKDVLNLFH
jgi:hypothetical protein